MAEFTSPTIFMALAVLIGGCTGSETDEVNWLVAERDLGPAKAVGAGYSFDGPLEGYFAAGHVTPDLEPRWDYPSTNIPLMLWENVLQAENISDVGTCPYRVADGAELSWRTNCRSQDGYNWDGSVSITEFEDAHGRWQRFEFDVRVDSDLEGRAFDHINLEGEVFYLDGDDEPLSRYSQANMLIDVQGYWERGFEDELEQAWRGLAMTGRWQTTTNEDGPVHNVEALVDLGALGGFQATITDLDRDAGCVVEPSGDVVLVGADQARLTFEGSGRCDGCAEFYKDGERLANACGGF